MTFMSVAAAVAFLTSRPLWQRIIISVSAVPIAIFCNMSRVAGQGLLDRWSPKFSEHFAHMFVGLVMLIPAFFLILLVAWILDRLFIEEAEPAPAAVTKPRSRKPVGPKPGLATGAPKSGGKA
jgi:exosortase/archaeosortase family protein